jgi:hypothetical protein
VELDQAALRLLARRAELRRALRFGEVTEAARAASRARVAGVQLPPYEREAARTTRAALGHALREARYRAAAPLTLIEIPAARVLKGRPKRNLAPLAMITAFAMLVVLLVALLPQPEHAPTVVTEDPGGAPAGGVTIQVSELSRGRTAVLPEVSVVETSPSPSPAPTTAATARATVAPVGPPGAGSGTGGQGGAGSGSGTGVGSGSGRGVATPTPTPVPTATPTPVPTPTPTAAASFTRIRGRVIDSATGAGIAGVCLVPGSLECDASSHYSDANGYWWIDVTTGAYWDIRFQGNGYRVSRIRVYAGGREINVGNVRLLRSTSTPTAPPA